MVLPKKSHTRKKLGKHIELEKLEVVPLFHVTPRKNRASIKRYGLLLKGKCNGLLINYEPCIFVSTTYDDVAFDYVHFEEVDVWMFYLPKDLLNFDECSDYANHYYISCPVPYYKLHLFESR